jgi:hypothetical protein
MTDKDFTQCVLAQVNTEAFRPMVLFNPDDDSLEILISNESFQTERIGPYGFLIDNLLSIRVTRRFSTF